MATFIAGRTEIYGVRPPSRITEMIAPSEVRASVFSGGAKRIDLVAGGGGGGFAELMIRQRELDGLIAHVCAGLKADDPI